MKPFTVLAAILFTVIAGLHALRLIEGWLVTVNGFSVPMWTSVAGVLIGLVMAIMLWRETRS